MTPNQIDEAVATEVMGYPSSLRPTQHGGAVRFSPSTDIAAAWRVVEKFVSREIRFSCIDDHKYKYAEFFSIEDGKRLGDATELQSLPLAICLAALQAVRSK